MPSVGKPLAAARVRPLASAVTEGLRGGRIPQPGDYLVTGPDFLTDELGNRLIA